MKASHQVWEYLTSPTWWIGVVFVSFAVNLLAAYTKQKIDELFQRHSEKRRKRKNEQQQKFEELVTKLKSNPEKQAVYASRTNFYLLLSIGYDLAAVFILLVITLLTAIRHENEVTTADGLGIISGGVLSVVCVILSYYGFSIAIERNRALRAANKDVEAPST